MDGGGERDGRFDHHAEGKERNKAQEEGAKDGRREEKGGKIQLQCGVNFAFDETELRFFFKIR